MLLGSIALLVKFVPVPWQVVGTGVLAVGAWALRSHWQILIPMARPTELRDGVMWGVRYYFGTIFIVALFFHNRPDILTATWLVLAVGDGLSAIVGGPASPPVPWNKRKKVYGSIACFLGSSLALLFALIWMGGSITGVAFFQALVIGAAVAVLESLDTPLDDNLLIGLGTSSLCLILGFFSGVPIWG